MFVKYYHHLTRVYVPSFSPRFIFHSLEIQRRCESIVKMVEKEIADIRKQEEEEEAQKMASTSAEGAVRANAAEAP